MSGIMYLSSPVNGYIDDDPEDCEMCEKVTIYESRWFRTIPLFALRGFDLNTLLPPSEFAPSNF